MSSSVPIHIAIVGIQAWSHNRSLCILAARLVQLRHVKITYFIPSQLYDKATEELARNFDAGEDITSRIRVVGLRSHPVNPLDFDVYAESFAEQYPKFIKGEPFQCAHSNAEITAWHPPKAIIFDLFGYPLMQTARALSAASVQMLCWFPSPVVALHMMAGPFGPETVPQLQKKIEETMKRTGQTLMDVSAELLAKPTDEVLKLPGFPPMYKYETYPQKMAFELPIMGLMFIGFLSLVQECDGIITSSSVAYESPVALQDVRDYLAATGRANKLYVVGPLLPHSQVAAKIELEQASKSPEILAFMDKALEAHGKHSVVYISFGTTFWPTEPEKVWAVFDVLIERKVPFLFSHASAFSTVPEEVTNKVQASGVGMIVSWAPQQVILAHAAAGWFITHGGFNSITESIDAGVPMICWPFGAEQPLNAIHTTETLDIAYELLEVRNGEGLKPIYRTGKAPMGTVDAVRAEAKAVFDKAFGEDGRRKRENVLKLKEASRQLWEEGGASRQDAERFLNSL